MPAESELVPIERELLLGSAVEVAPQLLNLVLVHGETAGRIVEVEAYEGAQDAASHAFRGRTARNAVMFGPPGYLYVYFTYGMHYCANIVCGPEGVATAVLLRALEPLAGIELMRSRRRAEPGHDELLAAGPARLCQALGIDRTFDGADLFSAGSIQLLSDGVPPPLQPNAGPRIGISKRAGSVAAGEPWRYGVPGSRAVSKPRFSPV